MTRIGSSCGCACACSNLSYPSSDRPIRIKAVKDITPVRWKLMNKHKATC